MRSHGVAGAAQVKADVEHWLATGITLSVGNAQSAIEEVTQQSVEIVELAEELTPPAGARIASKPRYRRDQTVDQRLKCNLY
jgi:hypothetical protein